MSQNSRIDSGILIEDCSTLPYFKWMIILLADVKTPVIVLLVGGDKFSLNKVAECVETGIAVVIVNESGPIAEMLADVYHAFDSKHPL